MDQVDRKAVLQILTRDRQTIRLHAGELTAREMLVVQAVLGWMRSEVERLPATPPPVATSP